MHLFICQYCCDEKQMRLPPLMAQMLMTPLNHNWCVNIMFEITEDIFSVQYFLPLIYVFIRKGAAFFKRHPLLYISLGCKEQNTQIWKQRMVCLLFYSVFFSTKTLQEQVCVASRQLNVHFVFLQQVFIV